MVSATQKHIIELRKREKEVKKARAYAEAIIADIADPLWVTDKKDNWVLVNEAMKGVTGYNEKDMLEKQMLTHPLFRLFISMLDGKEKLKAMMEKMKKGEHIPGLNVPWLTKDERIVTMSCSGEPLRDAEGKVIGGVFVGKDMSVLQKTGIATTKVLNKRVEEKLGKNYGLATMMLMSNATLVVGDSALEILKGVVEGYNKRFSKKIRVEEGIALKNVPEKDWPAFIEFLLSTFYECIGPTTFECTEGIESIKNIVERVKARYGAN
jgi:PAS domain S-box-containing protein